jgi:hypothetical protein
MQTNPNAIFKFDDTTAMKSSSAWQRATEQHRSHELATVEYTYLGVAYGGLTESDDRNDPCRTGRTACPSSEGIPPWPVAKAPISIVAPSSAACSSFVIMSMITNSRHQFPGMTPTQP